MFSLVRNGPKILLFKSLEVQNLKDFFVEQFNAKVYDFDTAINKANENYTMLFISEEMKDVVDKESIKQILIVKEDTDVLLCHLLKMDTKGLINDIRTAPRILLMRIVGDPDIVMNQIQMDLGGELGSFMEMLESGNEFTTLVSLTEKPLSGRMGTGDLFGKTLKLEGNHYKFVKELRMHALKYLNVGIGNKDWNEIEIRIFDRYSAYKLHYDRLIELFENLELGIVLGESWSKDYPRLFMSVEVYRVRFFTFHDPKYIKKLLLGMEYLEDGTRIVDYDVYFNQKKMDWTDVLEKKDPRARNLSGLKYRQEIFSRLSSKDAEVFLELEKEIFKTRT